MISFLLKSPMDFSARKTLFIVFSVALVACFFVQNNFAQGEDEEVDEAAQAEAIAKFNQGQEAHEKGDWQTALKLYDEAIKFAPEFPEAEYQRGNALLSLKRTGEAEKAFRRAIELRDDWTLPMASLGNLLVENDNFAEAEQFLTKAIELDANNFPAYAALTELRLKIKASPPILKELLTKIKSLTSKANPTASIWAAQGAIESALGDKIAAKKSLNNALALDSKNVLALQTRVEIALTEADFTKALNDARSLIAIAPDSTRLKVLLARVYVLSGENTEALKIIATLDSSNPNVSALKNSIVSNDSTNVAELEKELEKDAKNAAVLGRLCSLLRVENPTKALAYCRRASELEPENVNHAVGFGAALVQAKQYENAANILKRIIQIAPDNYTARANLATALFQSKRYAEAVGEYEWLREKQPKLAVGYYFLAISLDNLEQYVDAMANYQHFLKTADPNENKLEIEKVNLRLPSLQKLIKKGSKK